MSIRFLKIKITQAQSSILSNKFHLTDLVLRSEAFACDEPFPCDETFDCDETLTVDELFTPDETVAVGG